jgi:fucose permease
VKAISSFCGPFIAAFAAVQLGNWQYIFPIYALITLISTIWLMVTPIREELVTGKASSFGSVFSILKDKTILIFFLGIVCVVGVDVGINTAAPKILMERSGLNSIEAGYGPSMYFAFRTIGAFIGAILLAKYSPIRIFKIITAVAVLALIALVFTADKVVIFALYAIIGLAIANVFSIIFSLAIQSRPKKANEISGLMIMGVFGGAVIPFIMGLTSDMLGSQVGSILIILLSAIYLLFCAYLIKPKVALKN